MATPLLQKARQRKMIYFGAIIALFTLSLVHREFIVKPQAMLLQLRETSRGEVELTSSAVRLMLTGSRGLAVTMLWYTAMDKQKRGEYHELELIVASITKLQPYFVTPWLYQSWNISFNVAVECDRPRDKYYYISRGLELAAEGERRNSGTAGKSAVNDPHSIAIPGNPELRHWIGFIYQLKIGNSDERLTMRSLLELSCIDPIQRNPDLFWTTNEKGYKAVNIPELAKFTERYPRLIRRLYEQLQYTDPQRVVQFLDDHKSIPSRFKPIEKSKAGNVKVSELKDPLEQFPIVPPPKEGWPDPSSADLTSESIDVFLMCRTWYEYAQQPLPPPDQNPTAIVPDYDKFKYRVPKGMVTQLFRQYPARAQVYIAETLESEGWFDRYGWDVSGPFKKWSNRQEVNPAEFTFGTEAKYRSGAAWQRGYEMYKEFGIKNGIYIAPADLTELNQRAELIRRETGAKPGMQIERKPEWREGKMGESYNAHMKLYFSDFYRRLANFDTFLYQSEGEADPLTVAARKVLYAAERSRRFKVRSQLMLELYEEGWELYKHACFKHPRFAQVGSMQEDLYEIHQRYLREMQDLNAEVFRQTAVKTAKIFWPEPSWLAAAARVGMVAQFETDPQELINVMPIRKRFGSLDMVHYYDGPSAKEITTALYRASQMGLAMNAGLATAPQLALDAFSMTLAPEHEYYYLTKTTKFVAEDVDPDWRPLITNDTRRIVAGRLGLDR